MLSLCRQTAKRRCGKSNRTCFVVIYENHLTNGFSSEFCQRFAWSRRSRSASRDRPATPGTPRVVDSTPTPTTTASFTTANAPSPLPPVSGAAPLYSRDELTHVRTFRVYEAIKIDDAFFGTAI